MRSILTAALAAASLMGCASVVPGTAARLASLSPLETDPGDIQVALGLPEQAGIVPGSAKLILTATRSDTGEISEGTYTLDTFDTAADPALANLNAPGGVIGLRITPQDQVALRAQQATVRLWEAEAPDATQGSLGITLGPCQTGPNPGQAASIWVRTGPQAPFRTLVRRGPLENYVETDTLPPCTSAP